MRKTDQQTLAEKSMEMASKRDAGIIAVMLLRRMVTQRFLNIPERVRAQDLLAIIEDALRGKASKEETIARIADMDEALS